MMRTFVISLATGLILAGAAVAAGAQATPVLEAEAQHWICYTVPLPKKISMDAKVVVPASEVTVQASGETQPLVGQAVKELQEALGLSPGAKAAAQPTFRLSLESGGAEAAQLKDLPNSDQAYAITPSDRGDGLRIIALGARGLYYGSKTVQQMIKAKARGGRVEIPLLRVTDWPDLEDRGLWGGDSASQLRWLSDRKMNYNEQISHVSVNKAGQCRVEYSSVKQRMIEDGPGCAINPVPVILHLDQLKNTGLFEAYPELQGKDATDGIICYSNAKFADVLAEWLVLWGRTPGVSEVDVWMAENMSGKKSCQCEACRKEARAVLEARAILKAYEKARKQLPNLGLRMLSSEASEESNPEIIAMLPAEVKLWYYHSLGTYNTSRSPMVRPYLKEAVTKGHKIGVCANISAVVGFWTPMSSAPFIHARTNEFVNDKISGLMGYAVPGLRYCRFNTEAAAEWSWNAKGRSPHEFALSYAVRNGLKDPDRFAEWSDVLGPVSWDVYGSCFPAGEKRKQPGKVADLLKDGKLPELGSKKWDFYGIPFGDIKTVDQLNRDVEQAAEGVAIARALGIPEYVQESLVVQGYVNAIKALWELKQIVKPTGVADKAAATKWFQHYLDGLKQARKALPFWENALPDRARRERVADSSVKLLGEMIDGMAEMAKTFGIDVK